MIRHWKALDLEITDSEYHHDPTSSCFILATLQKLKEFRLSENFMLKREYPCFLASFCLTVPENVVGDASVFEKSSGTKKFHA